MTYREHLSNLSKARREFLQTRLEELSPNLKNLSANAQCSWGEASGEYVAATLFSRASFEFLESNTNTSLSTIVDESVGGAQEIIGGKPVFIKQLKPASYKAFVIATEDKPFIVSTIVDTVERQNLQVKTLLHPILTIQQKRISLCYLECEDLTDSAANQLQKKMEAALEDLNVIFADHQQMLARCNEIAEQANTETFLRVFSSSENQDVPALISWLKDHNFIFCGSTIWETSNGVSGTPVRTSSAALGIYRSNGWYKDTLVRETEEDLSSISLELEPVWITRLSVECPIHRRARLVHIQFPEINAAGKVGRVISFIGIFTAQAIAQDASKIPLVNRKVQKLIESIGVIKDSYDYKFIVDSIDRMPKDDVIRLNSNDLQNIIEKTIDVFNRHETQLAINIDHTGRGASVLVVMPRENFNEETRMRVQHHVERFLKVPFGVSEGQVDLSANALTRLYFAVPLTEKVINTNFEALEDEIRSIARTWTDNLKDLLLSDESFANAHVTISQFLTAFSSEYQAVHAPQTALEDLRLITTADPTKQLRVSHSTRDPALEGPQPTTINLYSFSGELTLSAVLPVLENSGFLVSNSHSYTLSLSNRKKIFLYRFAVALKNSSAAPLTTTTFNSVVAPGLESIFAGESENDVLNVLLVTAGLNVRSIKLLRSYASFLWQLKILQRKGLIFETIASSPIAASVLWNLFDIRFNPNRFSTLEERQSTFLHECEKFDDILRTEKDLLRDRTLRAVLSVLKNTLRTNFYLGDEAIALKLFSQKIDAVPQPRPLYEIFVHSADLEGVHLRTSNVARGGIRWSERPDDFRTEVHGLVKTQKIKNVFIVPQGAKGGFILRKFPTTGSVSPEIVKDAYKKFIRAMLSVVDNKTGETFKHPANIIVYDAMDPYFVVAADKGTATFSDTANAIATDEFRFWLDDAFASGGSQGYDHKLYGITARGTWESVKRHFHDSGIDYITQPFTAIGIGDMAGDVFGNGLLLSSKIQLIGAFNHKHIFLDPNPSPDAFSERKRLFDTKGSQWTDYSADLISTGGGVFERAAKELPISPEAKKALGLPEDSPDIMPGEDLISAILKAPVDLMWNGGIGTYVKSQKESHAEVNDSSNDRVRIDADEIRCKVVGEGGNLGFTQKARIEFAARGGKINTDAIDNAGGGRTFRP